MKLINLFLLAFLIFQVTPSYAQGQERYWSSVKSGNLTYKFRSDCKKNIEDFITLKENYQISISPKEVSLFYELNSQQGFGFKIFKNSKDTKVYFSCEGSSDADDSAKLDLIKELSLKDYTKMMASNVCTNNPTYEIYINIFRKMTEIYATLPKDPYKKILQAALLPNECNYKAPKVEQKYHDTKPNK